MATHSSAPVDICGERCKLISLVARLHERLKIHLRPAESSHWWSTLECRESRVRGAGFVLREGTTDQIP